MTVLSPHAARQARMTALVTRLAPSEGYTLSALDDVRFMRSNRAIARTPVLYEPSIVVVVQGVKRGFLGDRQFTYDAQQFLVLSVPLPFEGETLASEAEPLLALSIRVNLAVAAELALALDEAEPRGPGAGVAPVGISANPMDEGLADAVLRLLEALVAPVEAKILGPGILREIHYRVLTGVQGAALRASLVSQSHFGKIGKALRRIHSAYSEPLDVETLAGEAGISIAAFHARFKSVTMTSPIQYIKTTRLHKARLLMVQDGLSAATASVRVGYESASQFSREFKRFFGRTPQEEAREMRNALALTPQQLPPGSGAYVTYQQ
jgi:AraC-like DNA-binding protein